MDAFDEAEILSGWSMVEQFLDDLLQHITNAATPCLVLLARSEIADLIHYHLTIAETNPIHCVYSIDYFPQPQAKDFIALQLEKFNKNTHREHRKSLDEAVDIIFQLFLRIVQSEESYPQNAWKNPNVRSFLGYAPVLQAIARYLGNSDNFIKAANQFQNDNKIEIALVCDLLDKILKREQEKFLNQLKNVHLPQAAGWNDWETLYTPIEQLERLFIFTHGERKIAMDGSKIAKVPQWLVQQYTEMITRFLINHPFVYKNKFTGPAFQDYVFARLLAEEKRYEEVKKNLHKTSSERDTLRPSYLFVQIYYYLNDGRSYGDLVGYLYESAITQSGFSKNPPRLIIIPDEDEIETTENSYIMRITESSGEEKITFKLHLDEKHPIVFSHQLSHAYIEISKEDILVILGESNSSSVQIRNIELIVTNLRILSPNITVRNYGENESVYIETVHYYQEPQKLTIDCTDPQKMTISWKGGEQHPWSNYYVKPDYTSFGDPRKMELAKEAMLGLRRILSSFSRDQKGNFARYKLLIDNIVVGRHNQMRLEMRDFLIRNNIITHKEPLYILDIKALGDKGVNWAELKQGRTNAGLLSFLGKFFASSKATF
jgi:hypothetical protein